MTSHPSRFWWTVVALGWAFDFLFWRQTAGLNFGLFVLLCLVAGFLLLRSDGRRPARSIWPPVALIVFFACLVCLRREPMTTFLAILLTLFLIGVTAVSFQGGRWPTYSLLDYLSKFLQLTRNMVSLPLAFKAEAEKTLVWAVVRGVLLALPIVAIFACLLASADLVFNQKLTELLQWFDFEKLPEYLFRLTYILLTAYLLGGVFLHAATRSQDEKLIGLDKPSLQPFLGLIEAIIVLGSVALLFAAFVTIQFQYFFGGQSNIHVDGYTYSEYARRGFGELVTVAFFSLLLLLSAGSVTRREGETQRRIFSALGVSIVVLVLVMLVSAFQRLILYETAYGFSRLRTYTHVFMIWLGLLLVATVVLEVMHRERAFALMAVLASLGFVASLGVLNVDSFIVRQNVNRALAGEAFDANYLMELSDDAIPALARAYRTQPLPAPVKEGVGAALACYAANRRPADTSASWRSFHLARWNADRILAGLRLELEAYKVRGDDGARQVITPSGKEYFCYRFWD